MIKISDLLSHTRRSELVLDLFSTMGVERLLPTGELPGSEATERERGVEGTGRGVEGGGL